ncbi:MAG: 5-(carboxyamino)imidazole ribonucleotide synthase [Thermococcaceae archaeon]|jgi:5-(carboxyamino)imidazole ribonucleotide synthase|uniref:5-(carboxyamino)imidazole ribonucleotide synthase n=1 Tax=Thermococcus TaxID=2263 RepID=UPI001CEC7967|nr:MULTISPECIES: 5-(carboxyamino)imidazole ribonucleotide synthase [Thermococcus]MDK2854679.1 5-(carboxyamino)imidazole ribonucleotide synthase [Thermococcaceae archaeon]MDK2982713.1 5-(carboxyamino)imidazole ribonucleotide synthase [Thermococcaceae archaeon]MDN5319734.1 5-(carboxyamino)imidazole ribonucleotide synthase [Thermococcaceae archaeon]
MRAMIGILGGGQLAKMMAQEAKKLGFKVAILDPQEEPAAKGVSDYHIVGSFKDENAIRKLAEISDVVTYDIEHVNVKTLKELEDEGFEIHPSPRVLEVIQDKLLQMEVMKKAGIPVPKFVKADKEEIIEKALKFGFPLVQKTRREGYDGKGVRIIRSENELDKLILEDSMLQEFVKIEKEIAVMVARDLEGNVAAYPVVEMYFNEANILDTLIAPARISEDLAEKAQKIAVKAVEALDGVGIFGVEMFLTPDGKIYLNEIAPRPHNSGHYTIEACLTSQFEQHIRAIVELPLGSPELLLPAVMFNLLGEGTGKPKVIGLKEALRYPGVYVHIYGKSLVKPLRKMGHVTVVNKDLEKALEIANKVKKIIKVVGDA